MTFVSWGYYFFFGLVFLLYWIIPHKFRWAVLLAASAGFVSFFGLSCAAWLAAAILISYTAALIIPRIKEKSVRAAQAVLGVSTGLLLGSLFVLKYADYILGTLKIADTSFFSELMPIGISFYIFQTAGYIIDSYSGKIQPVAHFGKYAAAVSFFPKFIQGPIQPVSAFMPQLSEKRSFDFIRARRSAVTALFGIFKKVFIADRLAEAADKVFSNIAAGEEISSMAVVAGVIMYSFQLYADFSGYTDIALGSAGLLGFDLMPNFRQPYLSKSIAEFWRRWHITLSSWLRDYLYFPLGGSRVTTARWCLNVSVVFLVSGLWHGTGAGFIIWGLLHAVYQIIGKFTAPARQKIKSSLPAKLAPLTGAFSVLCTFGLVAFAWIFFRSATLSDAFSAIRIILEFDLSAKLTGIGTFWRDLAVCFAGILMLIGVDLADEKAGLVSWVEARPLPVRWLIYLVLLFVIIFFGKYGTMSEASFIYAGF